MEYLNIQTDVDAIYLRIHGYLRERKNMKGEKKKKKSPDALSCFMIKFGFKMCRVRVSQGRNAKVTTGVLFQAVNASLASLIYPEQYYCTPKDSFRWERHNWVGKHI